MAFTKGVLRPEDIPMFEETLNEKQGAMWSHLRACWINETKGRPLDPEEKGNKNRDLLAAAFESIKGTITADRLLELVDNAINKGDAQTLRVLAQLAGQDLTERKVTEDGPGAELIIIRPHPDELTEQGEARVSTDVKKVAGKR